MDSFFTQAENLGYRVDATAVHTYPGPSGGSSDNLINFVQSAYDKWGRPVWLTEFSFVDWGRNQSWSEEDSYQCVAEFLWRAEGLIALRKYALFVFTENAENPQPADPWQKFKPAPRSNSFDLAGNLTAFGKLYSGWDGDTTIRNNKPYLIHHKGSRKRLANLLGAGPGGHTIRVDGPSVNWTLAPTGTSGRYYIVSSRDGRRLSSASGAAPYLAPAGTTGPDAEWSLTAAQHGWQYLGHPASSRRLQLSYDNITSTANYSMVANTITGDAVQWRMIVPQVSDNTAPVLAAIPPMSVNQNALLTFSASATDVDVPADALTYSLLGAPAGAIIHPATGVFNWTPTESQGPGSFNFHILVGDGDLTHDQAITVNVRIPLPSPDLDTDGDGISDLLEHAFVTDSGVPNGNPFRVTGANAGNITLGFPWNWQSSRLAWRIRHGHDPSDIAAWPVIDPGTITITREGDIDRITVTPAMTYPDRGFYVLEVIGD